LIIIKEEKQQKDIYPLCGILKCALCNYAFSSYRRNKKRYYRCTGYSKHTKKDICLSSSVTEADRIEQKIKEIIIEAFGHLNIFSGFIPIIYEENLKFLNTELEKSRKERDNLLTDTTLPNDIYKWKEDFIHICNNIREVNQEILYIENKMMGVQEQIFTIKKEAKASGKKIENFKEVIEALPSIGIQELYKKFIFKIEMDAIKKTGLIHFNSPINKIEKLPKEFSFL